MAATYEPIASQTLGSDTGTVTFSSIPATFTDLILITDSKRTISGTDGAAFNVRFNGDTASNYSETLVQGNGSSPYSERVSSQTSLTYFGTAKTSAAGNGVTRTHIMSYGNTSVYKTILCESSVSVEFVRRHVGLWRSTSAITSIDLISPSGSFKSGSTFSLFGIKAA